MAITAELKVVLERHKTFSLREAQDLAKCLLASEASELEVAALLGGMASRGETAEEIAGFALAMREAATTLPLTEAERDELVDTCGTGGDGSGTFNISTAAALVAAAAGARVAKHGNRAVTSRCGSADVLEALGIPISLSPELAAQALRSHGFCFLLASAHHPAMKAVMPVRRALGIRTIFNVLGPLLNPAGARRQLMGVYSPALVRPVAEAMPLLEVKRAMVVHGEGGLDELGLSGPNQVITIDSDRPGRSDSSELTPESLGLRQASLQELAGGATARENAEILLRIFQGERGPHRDVVLLNAAAVLVVAELAGHMTEGIQLAAETIDKGQVSSLVAALSS